MVYAGRTTDRLGKRLFDHTRDRLNSRWDRFSWFGLREPRDDGELEEVESNLASNLTTEIVIASMEALLIEALEPPQNRRRGDGFEGIEYIQCKGPEPSP